MGIVYFNPIAQGYIHSEVDHVNWDYVLNVFNIRNNINKNLSNLLGRYTNQVKKTIKPIDENKSDTTKISSILNLEESDIEKLFDEIVKVFNTQLDGCIEAQNLNESLKERPGFITGQNFQEEAFEKTTNSIYNALKVIEKVNQEEWDNFLTLYKDVLVRVSNKRGIKKANKNLKAYITELSKDKADTVFLKIIHYLENISDKYIEEGKISNGSMASSLNNIFSTTIGEKLSAITQNSVIETYQGIDKEITRDIILKSNGNITKTVGSEKVQNDNITAKTDISSSAYCEIKIGAETKKIILELNSSVKWYTPDKKGNIKDVSLQSTNQLAKMANEIFDDEYSVYNTLAFYNENNIKKEEAFRILRSSVIAANLEKFIAGSGKQITSNTTDTNQFLVVNNKYYSIYSVLKAYLDDIQNKKQFYGSNNQNDLIFMNLSVVKNDKINLKDGLNYEDAQERYENVKN